MSRAVNIQASSDDVALVCGKLGARITAIEPLASGGTRVVLSTSIESAAITRHYGKKVICGTVSRHPIRLRNN